MSRLSAPETEKTQEEGGSRAGEATSFLPRVEALSSTTGGQPLSFGCLEPPTPR